MNIGFAVLVILLATTAIISLKFTEKNYGHNHAATQSNDSRDSAMAAIASLEQLAAEYPENPEYFTQLGNLYYDNEEYEKAVAHYLESLKLRPEDPHVETDLATCYHYLDRHEEALEILSRVIQYRPDFSQARFNKGVVLVDGLKDRQGAIATWEELLRVIPDYSGRTALEQRIRELQQTPGQ